MVNDGSTDKTGIIMEGLAALNRKCHVVHNERNLGLGGAYKRGVSVACCDYLLIVAGDNAMPSSDMVRIMDKLGQADLLLPYLANKKLRTWSRRLGSFGYTKLINMIYRLSVPYYNGFVPRRNKLNQIKQVSESYAFQAEIVVKLIKGGCTYIDIPLLNTPQGEAKSVALHTRQLIRLFREIIITAWNISQSPTKILVE
jgi:glycosyltransferase involved in cell wall biosynthesis